MRNRVGRMFEQGTAGTSENKRPVDLVFEGGGVKGIGLVGAYHVLEERGYRPENMAGASAGAIVAALVAAGYSADELYDIMSKLDFDQFKDKAWEDLVPLLPWTTSILKDQGIYEGKKFFDWIKELLDAKDKKAFGDLIRRPDIDDFRYRYTLQVIVSDVTKRRMLVLPRDADKLGYRHPDNLEVALAVRMSMSIPIFFEPVSLINQGTGREHILVDGGMLSNFPVWLFDTDRPEWPTFGLKLFEPDPKAPLFKNESDPEARRWGVRGTLDYLWSLVETMMEAHDRLYIEQRNFDQRTIAIDTLGVGTTEFDLSKQPERIRKLYESGRAAAEAFLEGFDYEEHLMVRREGGRW
jgi:NTE family protein